MPEALGCGQEHPHELGERQAQTQPPSTCRNRQIPWIRPGSDKMGHGSLDCCWRAQGIGLQRIAFKMRHEVVLPVFRRFSASSLRERAWKWREEGVLSLKRRSWLTFLLPDTTSVGASGLR